MNVEQPVRVFGDEPVMMASALTSPVFVSRDRAQGVLEMERQAPSSLVILDDGFQHARLHRDLDLVVINTDRDPSQSYCLPYGDLRESLTALRRAGAVLLVEGEEPGFRTAWEELLGGVCSHVPCFPAKRRICGFEDGSGTVTLDKTTLGPVGLFSAIGYPDSFTKDVSNLVRVSHVKIFPDHFPYSPQSVRQLASARKGFRYWVTTEKDFVKAAPYFRDLGEPLLFARMQYEFSDKFSYFVKSQIGAR